MEGVREDVFPGISRAELQEDPAHADPYDGADLEQLETVGINLSLGPLSAFEGQPT